MMVARKTRQPPAGKAAELLGLYRRMYLLRVFEEEVQRLFLRGEIHGTVHLYNGQEASAVGISSVLTDGDLVAATYRGHGVALAQGLEPEALAAELMGRVSGICGGRAGSMNVVDWEHGLIGCFGIVGGSIAAATGAAVALTRSNHVAVAFFGDGAVNQGYFHECLNFAAVRKLPVVFVCENNLYGEFTPMAQATAGGDIAKRAEAFGIPGEKVDGNDVEAVRRAAAGAVERARSGTGPTLLEHLTYRHLGHSKSDPARYRPEAEVDQWLARDPLTRTRARLVDDLEVEASTIADAEGEVRAELEVDITAALAAPYPTPEADAAREFAPAARA